MVGRTPLILSGIFSSLFGSNPAANLPDSARSLKRKQSVCLIRIATIGLNTKTNPSGQFRAVGVVLFCIALIRPSVGAVPK